MLIDSHCHLNYAGLSERQDEVLASARALASEGVTAPGVDKPEAYHQRSGGIVLARSADWWDATQALREKFEAVPEAMKGQ